MEQQQLANSAAMGLMAGIGMGMVMVFLAVAVFMVVCHWKIYTKAGEPGWACLIPIYNFIVFLKIVNKPWWWIFLMIIPIVNLVLIIMLIHRLSLSFGKGAGFTLGILFFHVIFFAILAFDSSVYTKLPD
jgi:hypothetical protein